MKTNDLKLADQIAGHEIAGHEKCRTEEMLWIFTARRVCIARTMPWQDVYPSVCLSHAGIVSKRIHILKNISSSDSPTILVFPHQTGWQYSDRDSLTGAPNARGMEKITIFGQYLALSRKWCKIEP